MAQGDNSERLTFSSHPRTWRDFCYVYPVISRRSKGLSIGVNLNPDQTCNFNCIYCQVDRSQPPRVSDVDLDVVAAELHELLSNRARIFEEEGLRGIPPEFRNVKDIAFSGDGEPTASPAFPAAARLVAEMKNEFGLQDAKIIVLTNACHLIQPAVAETLAFLDDHNGEVWAKLDAGTQGYFDRVNRPSHPLAHVLDNIRATARQRPVVIQSLFMRIHGEPPSADEITAYVGRLRWLLDSGGRIKLVQVYTIARRPAQPYVGKLTRAELETIADAVRPLGVPVEVYA
jgi:wyosine [tRNA(Phe)-imidazoG37] synthetase (radical SAM superfamily)